MPLEALRLGCDATALDLNPVAYLALIASLVYPQRFGKTTADGGRPTADGGQRSSVNSQLGLDAMPEATGTPQLVDDVRTWAEWVMAQAEAQIGDCYPVDQDLPAPRPGVFWIYVLKCNDDSFYIGQSNNIPRRWDEHWKGRVSWTKSRLPVKLIHYESFASREEAVKREKELKTGFGRKWLKREYAAGRLAARQAGGAVPVAYLWAKTIRCPHCEGEVPLIKRRWLHKRKGKTPVAYQLHVDAKAKTGTVEVLEGEAAVVSEPNQGTMRGATVECPYCGTPTEREQIAEQGRAGEMGQHLLVVVLNREDETGRDFRAATEADRAAFRRAEEKLAEAEAEGYDFWGFERLLPVVPDEPMPKIGATSIRPQIYGDDEWGQLFNDRQLLSLITLGQQIRLVRDLGSLGIRRKWPHLVVAVGQTAGNPANPDTSTQKMLLLSLEEGNAFTSLLEKFERAL